MLPGSSHTIHELHENSPSLTWCAFEFLPSDSASLRSRLNTGGVALSAVKRVPDPGKSWWPAVLIGSLDTRKIHASGFDLYEITEPETASTKDALLFVIDWDKGRGFFYRIPIS